MYRLAKLIVGPLLHLLFQPWIRGAENIPDEGPAILASNHLAVIDSVFLPLMSKREITFVGKADYFTGTGFKGWLTKHFMQSVGVIPMDRSGGKASQVALEKGLEVLKRGELFGIYPEGTRSPDGRLYRGKTGIARLALESGAPIIPVAMVGTNKSQPIGKRLPRPERIGVIVGEPLDFSRYAGMENDRFALRSITDEVMYSLMLLSGQEYVDEYAANVKKRLEAEKKSAKEPEKETVQK
ncbi:MAG: lysophospholipid acyltransferase family protein [Mobiluncus porci]|uniref:1-acyl-sn-glycerol-3-phosphate acyltransferase n=1 Tax=Mobiluncus porci TaxID=2652278 RepID=A0A7K0JZW0_9ACTO|nr:MULTISPECIES: lysophospholipid acyltransferase family protein [Mobiluncus]MCI6585324.1 1-acyl-sn-glycerol-3-phosphate acyltransferase [Mobiluncus sp.]MDD7541467.1 lysophospholipid acyltransferase family protein [Mobiluncus porci]MDY5748452.1 lysophospholipid acyltransferase family protein [Mobiluncus porci]MST48791.1 1-acyl-sn-glycerol-3-phosphate acyltransferase [Mobiluncus porci]